MQAAIKKVVIVGGGTAGWMSAALIKKVLAQSVDIELVESDDIGIVGVGEATIPPIQYVNQVLGINEAEFLRETKSTLKLAIHFENWTQNGSSYYHTFGNAGANDPFCAFHHLVTRANTLGHNVSLWDYDLNYLCCEQQRCAKINTPDPVWDLPYAYHFDAGLYGQYLRKLSEKMGVKRTEGKITRVEQHPQSGNISALILQNGQKIEGDLFIDCSGFRALLLQQTLNTGYEDWSHWLPCNRAVAVASERFEQTLPYTRSIAHDAGWQWRIPLQHRNGNGLVYSSDFYSESQASDILMANLQTKALAEPRTLSFTTGRAKQQWNKNVVAVGLASGFLEPLESTSIYLIQSAIVRLLKLFPHNGISPALMREYNQQSQLEYETIRDFIILHYTANQREGEFWRYLRDMPLPERLAHKIELFKQSGQLTEDELDIFKTSSWVQVLIGQDIMPQDYHPLANNLTAEQLKMYLQQIQTKKHEPLSRIPLHDDYLKHIGALG
ncbi:tryptophan halogenase family protein [Neptunicella marina]|uniref:Tryptophan 7-halogenase n=1 Tax=Neptunicella marina TaxID=2125989 RepID=A0A8J6IRT0_9ALTE|nr:tryptophan halogenase family protein [Neptunicella marina]MBC3765601.1 tryptophan 7-halogenase [Neptunicella marina]